MTDLQCETQDIWKIGIRDMRTERSVWTYGDDRHPHLEVENIYVCFTGSWLDEWTMVLAGKVEKESEVATTSKRNTSSYTSSKVARYIAVHAWTCGDGEAMPPWSPLCKEWGVAAQPICLNESRLTKEKSEKNGWCICDSCNVPHQTGVFGKNIFLTFFHRTTHTTTYGGVGWYTYHDTNRTTLTTQVCEERDRCTEAGEMLPPHLSEASVYVCVSSCCCVDHFVTTWKLCLMLVCPCVCVSAV